MTNTLVRLVQAFGAVKLIWYGNDFAELLDKRDKGHRDVQSQLERDGPTVIAIHNHEPAVRPRAKLERFFHSALAADVLKQFQKRFLAFLPSLSAVRCCAVIIIPT